MKMHRWTRTLRAGTAATLAVLMAGTLGATSAGAIEFKSSGFELETSAGGAPERRAGAHPDARFTFSVPQTDPNDPSSLPVEQPHRLRLELPRGLVGNPRVAERCSVAGLKAGSNGNTAVCPVPSQVGFAVVSVSGTQGSFNVPVFNIPPPPDAPAAFAFNVLGNIVRLTPEVRGNDYGITMDTGAISTAVPIVGADVVLWGVPADPANDALRVSSGGSINCFPGFGCFGDVPTASPAPRLAMLSTPTECTTEPVEVRALMDGWKSIGSFTESVLTSGTSGAPLIFTGCEQLPFDPQVDVAATARAADAPSGLEVDLRVPQSDVAVGRATAHVKDVAMILPEGMSVSPGSAAGLGACLPSQIGLGSDAPDTCPRSSKLGTVSVETPLLDEPLTGDVILAAPDLNPFGSLVALYIIAEGSGVRIKLPGRIDTHPVTGRLTATFVNNPQLPFSRLVVRLDGGANASLATPTACGRYETKTAVSSWSGKSVVMTSPMVIDQNCATGGFAPGVLAGSVKPLAAKDSPFVMTIDRPDGQQNLADVGVEMPPGLLARISDIDLCGAHDAAVGSCNDRSLVGAVRTTAGPGSAPLPVWGKVFLTGPYKGGPYGLSIVVPTAGQAGPFDLGNVVVRARITVDPKDAHVTVLSDPLPTILKGFPLRIRQVQVSINHARFMINPSSCEPMHVGLTLRGTGGGVLGTKQPYRVSGCGDLEQDQKIGIKFTDKNEQRPGRHPGLEAKLTSKGPGVANLKKVIVKLPLSVALDPDNAKALCEPEQKAARACPADSIVGNATAKSVLKQPLTGPIYFVRGTRVTKEGRTVGTLPKLWIPLSGGGVTIDVNADSDVDNQQRLVSTFDDLPDAPLTEFDLKINGGENGILRVPPSDEGGTCDRHPMVNMQLTGQNGAVKELRTRAQIEGCKTKKKSSSKSRSSAKKKASAKKSSAKVKQASAKKKAASAKH